MDYGFPVDCSPVDPFLLSHWAILQPPDEGSVAERLNFTKEEILAKNISTLGVQGFQGFGFTL